MANTENLMSDLKSGEKIILEKPILKNILSIFFYGLPKLDWQNMIRAEY